MSNNNTNHTNHVPHTATVYALAVLELAWENNQQEEIGQELAELQKLVRGDAKLRLFLADPAISESERTGVLDRAFRGRVAPLVMNLLGVLNNKGKLKLLADLGDAYAALLAARLGRVEADITVAQKLDEQQLEAVRQKISQALKKDAVVHQYVDESILGGLVVRVQDKLIDGSTRYQLQAMRQQLLDARPR